ncbi:flagellin [Hyphomonas sp.]|uniref:flagellin n=1 Tax=Hyphomonas sp. TaxID=87 RepID=UPI003F72B510|tara:strand:+ start:65253 stop:66233 length:981 start_codon:yes stop_codon:yes gene_type:complete
MLRIPSFTNLPTSGLSHETVALRDKLTTTSREAVTGRYSDLTKQLSGRISHAMLGQKALDDLAVERTQLTLRGSRLDITQSSLAVIQDRTNGLSARMQAAMGSDDQGSKASAARDSRAALEETFSALNTRYGDRYLFAGNATSAPPLASLEDLLSDVRLMAATAVDAADFAASMDTYFNTPGGGWRQNIYSGTETSSDPDAVPGTDPSLIQIVSGLAVMALSGPDETLALFDGNSPAVFAAAETLQSGQTALTNRRADVGISQAQIERRKEALDIEETVLTATFNETTARDQYEAASELRELESNLEASYLLTSRLANLSLMNYLR